MSRYGKYRERCENTKLNGKICLQTENFFKIFRRFWSECFRIARKSWINLQSRAIWHRVAKENPTKMEVSICVLIIQATLVTFTNYVDFLHEPLNCRALERSPSIALERSPSIALEPDLIHFRRRVSLHSDI